jgi:hypothetical protein
MKFDHLKKVGTLITPDYEYIDPSIPTYQISGESPKDVYQDGSLLLVHDCIGLKNEGLYQVLPQDIENIKARKLRPNGIRPSNSVGCDSG